MFLVNSCSAFYSLSNVTFIVSWEYALFEFVDRASHSCNRSLLSYSRVAPRSLSLYAGLVALYAGLCASERKVCARAESSHREPTNKTRVQIEASNFLL